MPVDEAAKRHRRLDGKEVANDDLTADQTECLIRDALLLAFGYGVAGAALYVACPAGTLLPHFIAAVASSGFVFKHSLVWVKDQFVMGRADYHYRHESILYGWKEGAHYFADDRTLDSVFECPRPKRSEEHPTMKPVELVQQMVENSSKRGEVVFDCFGGSGTTLIACEQIGRRSRLMELSPEYCDVIIQRFENATQKQAELVEHGCLG